MSMLTQAIYLPSISQLIMIPCLYTYMSMIKSRKCDLYDLEIQLNATHLRRARKANE